MAAGAIRLYDSYHCSRYNTNTRVLTPEMFRNVFANVRKDLDIVILAGRRNSAQRAHHRCHDSERPVGTATCL
jgi:hypothetical protein